MIQEEFRDLVFDFARHASIDGVAHIFLFGSAAKGEADRRSDVDLLIVLDTYGDDYEESKTKTMISDLALTLEKQYDRRIQIVFTNKGYKGIDAYFIEKVLKEGVLLYSKTPVIAIDGLNAESYSLIVYSLEKLNQKDKMKVKRLLYGSKTRKIVENRTYENETVGLVQQLQGIRIGSGAIAVPQKGTRAMEDQLTNLNVIYKKVDLWITEDGLKRMTADWLKRRDKGSSLAE
jgi:predicted nucleotidyltransferase